MVILRKNIKIWRRGFRGKIHGSGIKLTKTNMSYYKHVSFKSYQYMISTL